MCSPQSGTAGGRWRGLSGRSGDLCLVMTATSTKYFERKGYKELEGFKEALRQRRMEQCPFQRCGTPEVNPAGDVDDVDHDIMTVAFSNLHDCE